jgi:hypothetical protein
MDDVVSFESAFLEKEAEVHLLWKIPANRCRSKDEHGHEKGRTSHTDSLMYCKKARGVLAKHYTGKGLEMLKRIYEKANPECLNNVVKVFTVLPSFPYYKRYHNNNENGNTHYGKREYQVN